MAHSQNNFHDQFQQNEFQTLTNNNRQFDEFQQDEIRSPVPDDRRPVRDNRQAEFARLEEIFSNLSGPTGRGGRNIFDRLLGRRPHRAGGRSRQRTPLSRQRTRSRSRLPSRGRQAPSLSATRTPAPHIQVDATGQIQSNRPTQLGPRSPSGFPGVSQGRIGRGVTFGSGLSAPNQFRGGPFGGPGVGAIQGSLANIFGGGGFTDPFFGNTGNPFRLRMPRGGAGIGGQGNLFAGGLGGAVGTPIAPGIGSMTPAPHISPAAPIQTTGNRNNFSGFGRLRS